MSGGYQVVNLSKDDMASLNHQELTKREKLPVIVDTPTNIDTILADRGKKYGKFKDHAKVTQDLKRIMVNMPKWYALKPDQKEALEMIAHKIGRILNGDPDYADSWDDIAGYAKLVGDRLNGTAER